MANNLDQFFQKKLRNRKFTPKAGDWAAMESLLNSGSAPPSNSISINWIYSGLFIVLVGIGIYIGLTQDLISGNNLKTNHNRIEKIKTYSELPIKYESGITSNKNSIKKKSNQDLRNNILSKKEENRENTITINKELLNNTNSEKVSESINVSKKINQSQNSIIAQNSSKDLENHSPDYVADILSKSEKTELDSKEEKVNTTLTPSTNSVLNIVDEKVFYESNKAEKYNTSDPLLFEYSSTKKDDHKNTEGYFTDPKFNYAHLFLSSTPIQTFQDNQTQQSIISAQVPDDSPQRIKALKAKRSLPIQLSIAAFGEISYITKKIKGDNEFSYLSSIRNAQEKNIVSGGLGLELQASYKNIGLSSGISLGQWGENIQYEEKYTSEWEASTTELSDTLWTEEIIFTYDTIVNPVDSNTYIVIIDSSFVTVVDSIFFTTVYDSTLVETEIGLAKQNGRSTIQYWEIPLYFSYKFDIGDFYLSPGIGVTIGFLKITKGYYMGEDLMSLIPINTQYAVFKKTLVNGLINFGVGYRLGDRFSVEATPSYRFNLTNILENPGMIQRYSSISLQFRLRYYF